jgi:hypothetical protein
VNPAFVSRWVGATMFAGGKANALLAIVSLVMTFSHALAVVSGALGQRLQIGVATLCSGVAHVVFAVGLGWWLGIEGVLLAGIISHGLVFPALAYKPFVVATRMSETELLTDVVRPWALRFAPLVVVAVAIQQIIGVPSLPVTMAIGGLIGLASMWFMRPLFMNFGPVRALYDRLVGNWLTRPRNA